MVQYGELNNMSNKNIVITLPDGTSIDKPAGITGLEIAEGISMGLAKQSILIEVNGQLRDLSYQIFEDSNINILKKDADVALETILWQKQFKIYFLEHR